MAVDARPHGRLSPLLRAAAQLRGLRRVRQTALVDAFVAAHYQAQAVEQVWRYVARELTGRQIVAWYRPRGNSIDVLVRHNTSDGNIVREFNAVRLYDPPFEIDRRLRALGRRLRIVDLGAHIGLFGARILSLYPTAQVTAFEPDPLNRLLLEQTAVRSRRSWTVVGAAAWTENTTLPFRSGEFAASQVDWAATERVAAVDVFPYLAGADLVKIDVEGTEWRLLADPRFAGLEARAIVLEWHPQECPTEDPEGTAAGLLHDAGFATKTVEGAPPGVGMLWAWRGE